MDDGAVSVGRVEELITALTGVVDARVVADTNGEIEEIHVLSDPTVGGKQTVRNVESALLAELGLEIDHRKVSVATLKDDRTEAEWAENQPEAARSSREVRLEFTTFEWERRAGEAVCCRVTLLDPDQESVIGEARGIDSASARLSTAASAVIDALKQATDLAARLTPETVQRYSLSGRDVVVAIVLVRHGRETVPLAGAALVSDSEEEAAALACLDAVNRWLGRGEW